MVNWQTKYGRDELRSELKKIEETFLVGNLRWDKLNQQKEDALAVAVDAIKRQVQRGLIQLKPAFNKEDELYKTTIQNGN